MCVWYMYSIGWPTCSPVYHYSWSILVTFSADFLVLTVNLLEYCHQERGLSYDGMAILTYWIVLVPAMKWTQAHGWCHIGWPNGQDYYSTCTVAAASCLSFSVVSLSWFVIFSIIFCVSIYIICPSLPLFSHILCKFLSNFFSSITTLRIIYFTWVHNYDYYFIEAYKQLIGIIIIYSIIYNHIKLNFILNYFNKN